MERTTPRRNQRNGTLAMLRFPGVEIVVHSKHFTIRPRKAIEIRDCWTRRCPVGAAVPAEDDSFNLIKVRHTPGLKPGNKFLECPLAFIDTDNIDAVRKILIAPLGCVR